MKFAFAHAAVRHPGFEEKLWEIFDRASLAATVNGANYDSAANRTKWEQQLVRERERMERGETSNITLGTFFAGLRELGWVDPANGHTWSRSRRRPGPSGGRAADGAATRLAELDKEFIFVENSPKRR